MAEARVLLRSPEGYAAALGAVEEMRRCKVWPTPLNFELWTHMVAQPEGPLGVEVRRLMKSGEPITEARSEELAAKFLPDRRLDGQLREAGDQLTEQLAGVTQAIVDAQMSSAAYGRTLAGAREEIEHGPPSGAIEQMVRVLAEATKRVQDQNATLEKRLSDSTSEVQRLQENLDVVRRDAMTDALTSLANRKAFDDGLNRAVQHAAQHGEPLTLVVLDIDHFKRFNDTWGHQTGDQVIRYVASVLQRLGAAPRVAARYGGEEFALVLPGDAAATATRMVDAMRLEIASRSLKRRSTNEDLGAVTVSAGVAEFRAGEAAAALLARADRALYASKRQGRNRVTNADPVSAAA